MAAAGAVFGFLAALVGSWLLSDGYTGFGVIVGAMAGLVIGYPFGVIIGIFIMDKIVHYRGWILAGAIGAVLGGVIPIAFAEVFGLNNNPDLLWALILLLPPLLATAGFRIPKAKRR